MLKNAKVNHPLALYHICVGNVNIQNIQQLHTLRVKKIPPWPAVFWHFSQTVENFKSFFTRLLHVPIYTRLQIFIQLSPTLTKLCHIKHHYFT